MRRHVSIVQHPGEVSQPGSCEVCCDISHVTINRCAFGRRRFFREPAAWDFLMSIRLLCEPGCLRLTPPSGAKEAPMHFSKVGTTMPTDDADRLSKLAKTTGESIRADSAGHSEVHR